MRWDVINELIASTGEARFLEIGVQHGKCGARVSASHKVGVDPEPLRHAESGYDWFFRGTSDQYFGQAAAQQQFDVVLVDGLHHGEQVLRDVDNALSRLAEGGYIVLHDCNPQSELAQRVPRATGIWNGDCWRAMVALRQRAGIDAFTVDTDHGVGVVRRAPGAAPLLEASPASTYGELAADRERQLGLVSPAEWQERLGPPIGLGRVAVVTANFGGRDTIEPVPDGGAGADAWLLFSDVADQPRGWQTVLTPMQGSPRAEARRVKTLALDLVPDADVILWVDGRIRVEPRSLRPLLRRALRETGIAGYPHPWRDCAYAEARECAELGLADADALAAQVAAYRSAGLPAGHGLQNTMVLARRRSPAIEALGRAWWDEIRRHTVRDQVSLPYVLWRQGLACGELGSDVYHRGVSPYFARGAHVGGAQGEP